MSVTRENILFLKQIEQKLRLRRISPALIEAESLIRYFGHTNRLDFFTGEKRLSSRARKNVQRALKTRLGGVPLPYILKETYFLGIPFYVTKDVLIPRPETELLAEEAVRVLNMSFPRRRESHDSIDPRFSATQIGGPASGGRGDDRIPEVLDIGTGCGCLAVSLTLARPDCRMTVLDISASALRVARKNIKRHGLEEKIKLVHSDLFKAIDRAARWDMIISNPPYIPAAEMPRLPKEVLREPPVALNGGRRGLAIIQRILDEAPRFLKKGGFLLMEIGQGQSRILEKRVLNDPNYTNLRFVKDFAGIDRIMVAEKWIK